MGNRLSTARTRLQDKLDKIYLHDYAREIYENTEEVYNATGNYVILIKKEKDYRVAPNVSGQPGKTGSFGGNRQFVATGVQPAKTTYERPENDVVEKKPFAIPAYVETAQVSESHSPAGKLLTGHIMVYLSTKYLRDREIEINRAEDKFIYEDIRYRIVGQPPLAGALGLKPFVAYDCVED